MKFLSYGSEKFSHDLLSLDTVVLASLSRFVEVNFKVTFAIEGMKVSFSLNFNGYEKQSSLLT